MLAALLLALCMLSLAGILGAIYDSRCKRREARKGLKIQLISIGSSIPTTASITVQNSWPSGAWCSHPHQGGRAARRAASRAWEGLRCLSSPAPIFLVAKGRAICRWLRGEQGKSLWGWSACKVRDSDDGRPPFLLISSSKSCIKLE